MRMKRKLLTTLSIGILCLGTFLVKSNGTQLKIEVMEEHLETHEEKLSYILNNQELYPKALVDLACSKEETIHFVYNYPQSKEVFSDTTISIDTPYEQGTFPLFLQWDQKWGYNTYGDNYMAINGCGPTTLAMVIVGLTGNTSINPMEVANFSYDKGYYVKNVGTSWELMTKGSYAFGIKGQELPLNKNTIMTTLKAGNPIIASMGPGSFTSKGHFVLLTGFTKEGKIRVNDSDSKIRSNQAWDIEVFLNEAKNLWSFSL